MSPAQPGSGLSGQQKGVEPLVRRGVAQDKIVEYLNRRGGAIESADGRGLTQALATAVGGVTISSINATLSRLETDGVISRDVRGKRTYRIAVAGPAPISDARAGAIAGLEQSVTELLERVGEIERKLAQPQPLRRGFWRRRG
jgi:predicted transcriptional regulator